MTWNNPPRRTLRVLLCMAALAMASACTVSYKFTGTSIDYNVIKTIQIDNIPIRSAYVWAPMGPIFNNQLQDLYANQTRLQLVKRGGDLHIRWDEASNEILMTGPATFVFDGELL